MRPTGGRLRHAETSLMGGLALEQVQAAAEALIAQSGPSAPA